MKRFVAVWIGQVVSVLGSALTGFGLAVYLYRQTGRVGDLAMIAAAMYLPQVVVAPWGGALADRFDRRRLMIAADAAAALATAALWACVEAGRLGPWTATALVAASASCNAVQWPAYEAAMVAMVPRRHLGRANGMLELGRGAGQLLAPLVAGSLFAVIGLGGLVVIDLASFAVGIVPLLLVTIPSAAPERARAPLGVRALTGELAAAWRAVARPGLVAMLVLFAVTSFTFAVVELLLKPLVLSFATPFALGLVSSAVGVGMVVGSLIMTGWGGPRRKIAAILAFQMVEGGALIAGGTRPSIALLCGAAFAYGLVIPLTFGCARQVWQVKIPHALQGRAAALRNAAVTLSIPIGYAVAAPLAALVTRLTDDGRAAGLAALVGTGRGRGLAVVVIAMGLVTCGAALIAFAYRPYRRVEHDLDDQLAPLAEAAEAEAGEAETGEAAAAGAEAGADATEPGAARDGWLARLVTNPINYWMGFGLDVTVAVTLITIGAITAGRPVTVVATVVGGALTYSFYEYAFHRWLYHRRRGAAVDIHARHHARPNALIGAPFFFSLGVCALTLIGLTLVVDPPLAAVGAGTVLLGYAHQSAVHHLIHQVGGGGSGWWATLRRHHLVHHRRSHGNYGVTTRVWDRVFGTDLSRPRPARGR